MKSKFFLLSWLLISFTSLFAQTAAPTPLPTSSGSVNGKIVDKTTGTPIPYATVSVKDGIKIITGGITKDNGIFNIDKLPLKNLTIEIQYIGYKKYEAPITLSEENKNLNLKTILLEENAKQLNEVSIVKERSTIEQKIDRKVVNVGKDLVASGTTAFDMLNNIPSISIDPQNKEISLRGNSNVKVLIDGKPSNIEIGQLLQQIPSASIKQVELITNPSAKYNPEGMSGLINIILHKNANTGFNGSINTGVTFGITPKTNTALNLNYKVGKVNLYTNYGFNHGINANHGDMLSENPTKENQQLFAFRNLGNSHAIKIGMDYYINDKNTLSVYTNQNLNNLNGDTKTEVYYTNPVINSNTIQNSTNHNDSKNQTYDLAFKHDFTKKGENLEFQANYSKTKDTENTQFENLRFNPASSFYRSNAIINNTDYGQLNLDYTNPLTEKTKLETGFESRLQQTKNNFDNLAIGENIYSNFDFTRNIHAVYANYSTKWKKWSAQLGLRVESYDIKGTFATYNSKTLKNELQTVNDNIFTTYPSAFLNYTPNEKNSFNFNYSRRVDRPSIGQLNPIRQWSTPLMEMKGNPGLIPQFTNSLEANYTRTTKMGSLTFGTFFRFINDEISRISNIDPNNIERRILSFGNFKDNKSYGIEASANLKFTKWWAANIAADNYFKTVRGTVQNGVTGLDENKEVDVSIFNARISNTFTASKVLRFQLFSMYRGKDISLQGERMPMYRTDLGANYTILKGKGTVTLRYNDIFNNMHFSFDAKVPYHQTGSFYWESRTFYAGLNYNFGGGKNRALQRKQRDANESQNSGGGLF
ncbi:TonB-dependent receptor domain-containing protein [Flavobacterium sp.]|uniref:TonB-dependent receptor domain-containing protein n=1 Tax=Flavobacterium sp. TaxID=239 RepID=UPI003D11F096